MIDLNELTGQFARCPIVVDNVFHAVVPGGYKDLRITAKAGYVFAVRGHAAFTFNGATYKLGPGLVAHGGKHMKLSVEEVTAEFEFYLIHYSPQGEAAAPTEDMQKHFVLEPGEDPKLLELLRQLHQAVRTPGNMSAMQAKLLFYGILYELFTCCRDRMNQESQTVIEQAIAYIHGHYMEPLNLQSLAERYGMKEKSFSYLFKKYVGLFPIDYVIQHRIKRAEELLAASSCPIGEIAAGVGYADAHYFSRLFKKHTGQAPSEFRRHLGNNPPSF